MTKLRKIAISRKKETCLKRLVLAHSKEETDCSSNDRVSFQDNSQSLKAVMLFFHSNSRRDTQCGPLENNAWYVLTIDGN